MWRFSNRPSPYGDRTRFIYLFFGSFGLTYKQSASLSSLDSVVTLGERASLLPQ